ncbi:MAG: dTMP kinase [Ignavibacterium album]|uniref:dTMP kinase n=1 Tax=Ignavibacterium album TaxID=591197 RepID=UPI0026EDB73A|nr:dTMP kinase [Ignavibacterium album]MBI5660904.1 dTMP kinase [Ignavibacterium album]
MFITFEGIDFCGKSTQVELLKNYFEKKGKTVKVIREPGGTEISEKIRDILLDKKNNKMFMETELLLFSASRAQLVREKINPFIEEGAIVISDRFHDSSTAYQGYGRGLPIDSVLNVHKLAIGNTIPDITFIIDIPVSIAVKRKAEKTHQELDRIEVSSNDFYEKVRNGYLSIAKEENRFRVVDGTKSIEEIHNIIINYIEEFEQR